MCDIKDLFTHVLEKNIRKSYFSSLENQFLATDEKKKTYKFDWEDPDISDKRDTLQIAFRRLHFSYVRFHTCT